MVAVLGLIALVGLSGAGERAPVEPLSDVSVTRAVAPAYPVPAVHAGDEGLVVVLVSIDADGAVTKASLVSETVPAERFPAERFENIAREWRFEVPEPMDLDLVFAFQLVSEGGEIGPGTTFELPTTVTVRATRPIASASSRPEGVMRASAQR